MGTHLPPPVSRNSGVRCAHLHLKAHIHAIAPHGLLFFLPNGFEIILKFTIIYTDTTIRYVYFKR